MKSETYMTIERYTCCECGCEQKADMWATGNPVCEWTVAYAYCEDCAAKTLFAIIDGVPLCMGTYDDGMLNMTNLMLSAGQVHYWIAPAGSNWDVERQEPIDGQWDELPF